MYASNEARRKIQSERLYAEVYDLIGVQVSPSSVEVSIVSVVSEAMFKRSKYVSSGRTASAGMVIAVFNARLKSVLRW